MLENELKLTALNLVDGGYRYSDIDVIKERYSFSDYESKAISNYMYKYGKYDGKQWYCYAQSERERLTNDVEKSYADYTSEDFIKAGIAKECRDCPDFCEEDCIENAECAKGEDVFEGCKTVKDVMEVKQALNTRFGNEMNTQYKYPHLTKTFWTFPTITEMYNDKCFCCEADRQGNRCGGEQYCMQTWKRYAAIINPEWHHVSIATLANIDFDMLDEKRKLVFDINQILKDGIRNLYKCENHISFEVLERYVIRKCDELIRHNRLKAFWFSYIARQLDEVRRNTIYLYTPYITAHRNRW